MSFDYAFNFIVMCSLPRFMSAKWIDISKILNTIVVLTPLKGNWLSGNLLIFHHVCHRMGKLICIWIVLTGVFGSYGQWWGPVYIGSWLNLYTQTLILCHACYFCWHFDYYTSFNVHNKTSFGYVVPFVNHINYNYVYSIFVVFLPCHLFLLVS